MFVSLFNPFRIRHHSSKKQARRTSFPLRTLFFQVLTRDSVTVSVDAVVYYRVSNATVSVANVENAHHSTRLLAQTTLRNILGTKNLHEILSDRESISGSMQVLNTNHQYRRRLIIIPLRPFWMKRRLPGASRLNASKCESIYIYIYSRAHDHEP